MAREDSRETGGHCHTMSPGGADGQQRGDDVHKLRSVNFLALQAFWKVPLALVVTLPTKPQDRTVRGSAEPFPDPPPPPGVLEGLLSGPLQSGPACCPVTPLPWPLATLQSWAKLSCLCREPQAPPGGSPTRGGQGRRRGPLCAGRQESGVRGPMCSHPGGPRVTVTDHDNETDVLCGQHQLLQMMHKGSPVAGPGWGWHRATGRASGWRSKGEDFLPTEEKNQGRRGCESSRATAVRDCRSVLDKQPPHHAALATKATATATGPHGEHTCPAQSVPFWSDYEAFYLTVPARI